MDLLQVFHPFQTFQAFRLKKWNTWCKLTIRQLNCRKIQTDQCLRPVPAAG
ncbi:MAG: hypothetical protein JWP44_2506 [Mucilaginibacter sp.]|nr:hypothetical protein [Mucilaginibacter sp.]